MDLTDALNYGLYDLIEIYIYTYIYVYIYIGFPDRCCLVPKLCPPLCDRMEWSRAQQAPLSMAFSRQEHWSGLPCPSPGHHPDLGPNPGLPYCRQIRYCLALPASSGDEGWEDPLEEQMAAHSVFLPEKSHGQRSLESSSP